MKKIEIIQKKQEFSKIIKFGQNKKNKYYSIYFIKNTNINRYGISVPKKVGNAVTRNKIKRQIKNIIDLNKKNIKNSFDYVIIVKEAIKLIDYQKKENELIQLIKE